MLTARFQLTKKFSSAWLTLETSLQVLSIPGCGLAPWKYLSVSNRCSVQLNCAWESIWMIFILFVSLLSGVESTILNVSSGSEMSSKARQLGEHFRLHGTPVMIGILKSSILKRLFKLELQPGCNSNEKGPFELYSNWSKFVVNSNTPAFPISWHKIVRFIWSELTIWIKIDSNHLQFKSCAYFVL